MDFHGHFPAHCEAAKGSTNLERILENLGAADVILTDEEFAQLETALNACTVHGHRGYEESVQHTFSDNWKKNQK